jgi:hypothetical protein
VSGVPLHNGRYQLHNGPLTGTDGRLEPIL